MRTAKTADGGATLPPKTKHVKRKNRPRRADSRTKGATPPTMPPGLARAILADAIVATVGLLDLLAINLANDEKAAAPLDRPASRTYTVALIRQVQCQLNEAASDAGM